MRYTRYPERWMTILLAVLIYANFLTHHYLPDFRYRLFVAVAVIFGRTWVYYKPYRTYRRMPLLLGFGLVALFIWMAEDIGTFAAVWVYPHKAHGWQPVHFSKYGVVGVSGDYQLYSGVAGAPATVAARGDEGQFVL